MRSVQCGVFRLEKRLARAFLAFEDLQCDEW